MSDLYKRLKAIRERAPAVPGEAGTAEAATAADTNSISNDRWRARLRAAGQGQPAAAADEAARARGADALVGTDAPLVSAPRAHGAFTDDGAVAPHIGEAGGQPGVGTAVEAWSCLAPLVWGRKIDMELPADFLALTGHAQPQGALAGLDPGSLFFLDTETTGLSGGAGTWAFLVGWSRLVARPGGEPARGAWGLEVSQYFLEDLGGEPDFVALITQALSEAGGLVSYNGASFDLPLLRTRWIMNGQAFPDRPHEDCLYPSRRFWRGLLGGASLGTVESAILGIRRLDDIPGALVPQLYLEYLRQGAGPAFASSLAGVFDHHAQDMVSLAALWMLIGAIRQDPLSPEWRAVWPGAKAAGAAAPNQSGSRSLLEPRPDRPVPLMGRALADCLDEAARLAWLRAAWDQSGGLECGRLAARALKQAARRAAEPEARQYLDREARALWLELWRRHQATDALVEALKSAEHRGGSAGRLQALDLIAEAKRHPLSRQAELAAELERRQLRLRRLLGLD